MKKPKWWSKPVTWGSYCKVIGIATVIGSACGAVYGGYMYCKLTGTTVREWAAAIKTFFTHKKNQLHTEE